MPRKILFIVNPNAGKKVPTLIINTIREIFPANIYYHIVVWKDKEHFEEITERLRNDGYTDAVAVGGDGTVNRVAATIVGTNIQLGVIPVGSGNGLARSLRISTDIKRAIEQIAEGRTSRIDHGLVNGKPFVCTSGVGLDAHIGYLFSISPVRGLKTYAKITMKEVFKYLPQEYDLDLGSERIKRKAMLITVANAGQYGNDFYISPQAKLNDGIFQVVVLKPFRFIRLPGILWKIIRRKAHESKYIETFSADKVRIRRQKAGPVHYDGEPLKAGTEVVFENVHQSLNVIVGRDFV